MPDMLSEGIFTNLLVLDMFNLRIYFKKNLRMLTNLINQWKWLSNLTYGSIKLYLRSLDFCGTESEQEKC